MRDATQKKEEIKFEGLTEKKKRSKEERSWNKRTSSIIKRTDIEKRSRNEKVQNSASRREKKRRELGQMQD